MKGYKAIIENIGQFNKKELTELIGNFTDEDRIFAESLARKFAEECFGKKIFFRGLIEFTNYCRNNCLYCGIRCANSSIQRYRLTAEQIMKCCERGYSLGFRTFVLQGGEDVYYTDDVLCSIVSNIRDKYPDCAITLSVGERSRESYKRLYDAGADRYLLRHETADSSHYALLHPNQMSYTNRMRCLADLKEIGFQTGCGIMVGSPYQTAEQIAEDILFMREFKPEMIGIGPFLPQSGTPFGNQPAGSVELTLFLISLIRIMLPNVLLPSTTALSSAKADGRINGIMAGANVVMPNLSPKESRDKYLLYDGKAGLKDEAGYVLEQLKKSLDEFGYKIEVCRGDYENIVNIMEYNNGENVNL